MSGLALYLFGFSGPNHTDWKHYGPTWHAVAADSSDYSYLDTVLTPYGVRLVTPNFHYGPASVRHAFLVQRNIAHTVHNYQTNLKEGGPQRYWFRPDIHMAPSDIRDLFPVSEMLVGLSTLDGLISGSLSVRRGTCDVVGIIDLLTETELASLEISQALLLKDL